MLAPCMPWVVPSGDEEERRRGVSEVAYWGTATTHRIAFSRYCTPLTTLPTGVWRHDVTHWFSLRSELIAWTSNSPLHGFPIRSTWAAMHSDALSVKFTVTNGYVKALRTHFIVIVILSVGVKYRTCYSEMFRINNDKLRSEISLLVRL